jgi:hypothetical protein
VDGWMGGWVDGWMGEVREMGEMGRSSSEVEASG